MTDFFTFNPNISQVGKAPAKQSLMFNHGCVRLRSLLRPETAKPAKNRLITVGLMPFPVAEAVKPGGS
jgi:hypothetical protein